VGCHKKLERCTTKNIANGKEDVTLGTADMKGRRKEGSRER